MLHLLPLRSRTPCGTSLPPSASPQTLIAPYLSPSNSPAPSPLSESSHEILKSVYNGVKLALGVVRNFAEPLPPLKATVEGFLKIIEVVEVKYVLICSPIIISLVPQTVKENQEEHKQLATEIKVIINLLDGEQRRLGDPSCRDALQKLNACV